MTATRRTRGVALLIVLVAVTLLSLATLVPLRNEQRATQHERETELLFIGAQFRNAIASYAAARQARGVAQFPKTLDDLLADKRCPNVCRHLRRVYADPFTGAADWTLIKQQGAIIGVASRSAREPLKRNGFAADELTFATAASYADWKFVVRPVAAASSPISAPAAPGPGAPDAAPPTEPAPAAPAPPPNPVLDKRRECYRAYSAALNACVLDQSTSEACRGEARLRFQACLRD